MTYRRLMTGRHASPACVVLANKRRLGENVDEKQVSMLSAPSRPTTRLLPAPRAPHTTVQRRHADEGYNALVFIHAETARAVSL